MKGRRIVIKPDSWKDPKVIHFLLLVFSALITVIFFLIVFLILPLSQSAKYNLCMPCVSTMYT